MPETRILYIEDEPFLAKIVREYLESRGWVVHHLPDGRGAVAACEQFCPHICVLDVMLPYDDGFSVGRDIHKRFPKTPIIYLTAKDQTEDVLAGFASGGNDYLRKPFSMEELIVRIKALLQRPAPGESPETSGNGAFQIGAYTFDPVKQILTHPKEAVTLPHRESELLRHLCMHRNDVLERSPVLKALWGDDSIFNARSMDVYITKIRRHLRHDPSVQIINVRGIGYKLAC
jgi:two-component system response regulator VicR